MKTLCIFTARWCNPCKLFKPVLDNVLASMSNIQVNRIDIDSQEGQVFITKFQVKSVPTLILFGEDRKEIKRLTGVRSEFEIKSWLNE